MFFKKLKKGIFRKFSKNHLKVRKGLFLDQHFLKNQLKEYLMGLIFFLNYLTKVGQLRTTKSIDIYIV